MFNFNKKKINYLMHKNIAVLKGEYSLSQHAFQNIEILHPKHLPIGIMRGGKVSIEELNAWWQARSIPSDRLGLDGLLKRLHIEHPFDLIEEAYGLSLSDTYWIKNEEDTASWDAVNFFHHSFDDQGFASAMFSNTDQEIPDSAKKTPNNGTAGHSRKAWILAEQKHLLYKGGSLYQQEPVNEWLASKIAEQLGLHAVKYETDIFENNLVSVCDRFTDENTDFVSCEYVLSSIHTHAYEMQYESYISALEKHGIQNARKYLSDQMILDYLLMNHDRHPNNMGIFVDANTNEWLDAAPVFDTGSSLGSNCKDDEILSKEHEDDCQLFNAKNMSYEVLLNYVLFDQYDFSSLTQLPVQYGNQLVKYQELTGITNERIENAYQLFYKRILSLKKAARYKML